MKAFLLVVGALFAISAVVLVLAGWSEGPRLPRGVAEIDIRAPVAHRNRPTVLYRRITDPAQVKSVVSWFNSLREPDEKTEALCAGGGDGDVGFTFRSANGSQLARADATPLKAGACNPIQLTFNLAVGTQTWSLVDRTRGMPLINRLERLLGPRFRPIHGYAG